MTMDSLNKIFKNAGVWEHDYSIGESHKPLSEVAFCLEEENGKYHFFVKERYDILEEKYFVKETDACIYFLKEFTKDNKKLKQYVLDNCKGVLI